MKTKISLLAIVGVLSVVSATSVFGAATVRTLGGAGTYTGASSAAAAKSSGTTTMRSRAGTISVGPSVSMSGSGAKTTQTVATTKSGTTVSSGKGGADSRMSIGKYLNGSALTSFGNSSSEAGTLSDATMEQIQNDISDLQNQVAGHDTDISNLESVIDGYDADIDDLNDKIGDLSDGDDEYATVRDYVDSRIGELDGQGDDVMTHVRQIVKVLGDYPYDGGEDDIVTVHDVIAGLQSAIGEIETGGSTKLYDEMGGNTDGSMTQAAITIALNAKANLVNGRVPVQELPTNIALNTATGSSAIALGTQNTASGPSATALGVQTVASGSGSSAVGFDNTSTGFRSAALGFNGKATGDYSTTVGSNNTANSSMGVAVGYSNTSSNIGAAAVGNVNTASGADSCAFGSDNTASGKYSSVFGRNNRASGYASSAFGFKGVTGTNAKFSVQIGPGTLNTANTFSVGVGEGLDADGNGTPVAYPMMVAGGLIPAERLTGANSTVNLSSDKILQFNSATKTMQWVDKPVVPTLESLLPELPSECDSAKCVLVHDHETSSYRWEVDASGTSSQQ